MGFRKKGETYGVQEEEGVSNCSKEGMGSPTTTNRSPV